jgi:predicted phage terminase large subunit-like protein
MELLTSMLEDLRKREARDLQCRRGGLIHFVRYFWNVVEPTTKLIDGWPLEAICQHLEAVTFGDIKRLLITVPPGFMKSLCTDVFWPAWQWGPMGLPSLRIVAFSYSAGLTERDNARFRDVIMSPQYRELYGDKFDLRKVGEVRISNDKTGWKLATSVGGIGTGERGNQLILDDPHNVRDGESDAIRESTVRWFREAMSNRLNAIETDAIVVIQQRLHEADVAGTIIEEGLGYEHLCIPLEYDPGRHCTTCIGWTDPRSEDGELAWPERFPPAAVDGLKRTLGPYAYVGQYLQTPEIRGGGVFKRDWWVPYDLSAHGNKFPPVEYVVASLDPAYTDKKENDPSGFTVWGLWYDRFGNPKLILLDAWRKRLELHCPEVERKEWEDDRAYLSRAKQKWGLVEWVAFACKWFKVNRLLIEAKAAGHSVAQEMLRLYAGHDFVVQLVDHKNHLGHSIDKLARAYPLQPLFTDGMIYAPATEEDGYWEFKDWAEMLISEAASFPKGKTDDATDSMIMALQHFRNCGLAVRREEVHAAEVAASMYKPRQQPLYDV